MKRSVPGAVGQLIRAAGFRRGGDLAQAMRAGYVEGRMAGLWAVVRATGDASLATDLRRVWSGILAEQRRRDVARMDVRIQERRAAAGR